MSLEGLFARVPAARFIPPMGLERLRKPELVEIAEQARAAGHVPTPDRGKRSVSDFVDWRVSELVDWLVAVRRTILDTPRAYEIVATRSGLLTASECDEFLRSLPPVPLAGDLP